MKKSIIDSIVLEMGCTEKGMPDSAYVISDDDVISRLNLLKNIHERDCDGRTLLMYAVLYKRYVVVQYLLARKADVRAQDRNQYTALHFAVHTGNMDIMQSLIEAGADVNARDKFGNSPLMRCNNGTAIHVIELLLKNGADPWQKNNYGNSAADAFMTREEVMRLFNEDRERFRVKPIKK